MGASSRPGSRVPIVAMERSTPAGNTVLIIRPAVGPTLLKACGTPRGPKMNPPALRRTRLPQVELELALDNQKRLGLAAGDRGRRRPSRRHERLNHSMRPGGLLAGEGQGGQLATVSEGAVHVVPAAVRAEEGGHGWHMEATGSEVGVGVIPRRVHMM